MANRLLALFAAATLSGFSAVVAAQESSSSLSLEAPPALSGETMSVESGPLLESSLTTRAFEPPAPRRLTIFMRTFPLPIVSGGMGVAAEYGFARRWSVFVSQSREDSNPFDPFAKDLGRGFFGERVSVETTKAILGGRHFFGDKWNSGLFATLGYRWSTVETRMEPGILRGAVARHKRDVHGLVAGGGFRFAGGGGDRLEWRAEISVNAEPGRVTKAEYIVDKPGFLFGADEAHAATNVGYWIFPEAEAGVSF